MGVHGLWRLLDASGKPVPIETLDGKILAVDVSIWFHQVLQGYQDGRGNPVPNAHLLGLFNRICKLLYYRIKPVFVFDGGVPMLKKNTIALRRKQKSVASNKAQELKADLMNNLLKRTAIKQALGTGETSPDKSEHSGCSKARDTGPNVANESSDNMFKLPNTSGSENNRLNEDDDWSSETESSDAESPRRNTKWIGNIHNVDVTSVEFKALPPDVRHDILTDLKETRKQNSWGRLHEMPEAFHEFSNYQMQRLLKRRTVQESLEDAEKEMGGRSMTLAELDSLLKEQGITTAANDNAARIATDNSTRFVYVNGSDRDVANNTSQTSSRVNRNIDMPQQLDKNDDVKIIEDINEYGLEDDWDNDWVASDTDDEITILEEKKWKKVCKAHDINPAMAYMLQNSGLTQEEVLSLIELNKKNVKSEKDIERPDNKKSTRGSKNRRTSSDSHVVNEIQTGVENTCQVKDEIIDEASHSAESDCIELEVNENSQTSLEENSVAVEMKNSPRSTSEVPKLGAETPKDLKNADSSVMFMSDSESSDDFVEVNEDTISHGKKLDVCKTALEIPIIPGACLPENDLFFDVFNQSDDKILPVAPIDQKIITETVTRTDVPIDGSVDLDEKVKNDNEAEDKTEQKCLNKTSVGNNSSVIITVKNEPVDTQTSVFKSEEPVETVNDISKHTEPGEVVDAAITQKTESKLETDNKRTNTSSLPINREDLKSIETVLENEQQQLGENINRLERQATDVTDQMRIEAQELLRFFGIPYIVAPMEAEAQCAYLETIELTHGTITDDSDIWLFGGRCVYKNFFNHNKRVLQFRASDIQRNFKLTREQMIQLALLVGSDYTAGVTGIGPVTAMEIIAAFPCDEKNLLQGLINFRYWMKHGRMAAPGRTSLRTKLKNVQIENSFPSKAVLQAYLAPTVDESKETFSWSKPNWTLLSDYTRDKFGWTKNKFENVFGPIIKKQEEQQKQRRIDSYLHVNFKENEVKDTMSKRVQEAVQRLGNNPKGDQDEVEEMTVKSSKTNNRKRSKGKKATASTAGPVETVAQNQEPTEVERGPDCTDISMPTVSPSTKKEFIPQREKDKANALEKKLRAIEVYKKSKKGPGYMKRNRRCSKRAKIKEQADLSESSDSS